MFENVDIGNYVPIFIDGHSHVGELPRVLLEWGFNYDSWLYYGLCEDEKQKEWLVDMLHSKIVEGMLVGSYVPKDFVVQCCRLDLIQNTKKS